MSLYGILLCNAGYAAAQAGYRARSRELLDDAHQITTGLGRDLNVRWTAFGPRNVILHQVKWADGADVVVAGRVGGPARYQLARNARLMRRDIGGLVGRAGPGQVPLTGSAGSHSWQSTSRRNTTSDSRWPSSSSATMAPITVHSAQRRRPHFASRLPEPTSGNPDNS